jgi:exodeoxyribonuclease V alpha subunit
VEVVRHNPYCLSADVSGIGFLTADRIARSLGIPPQDSRRIEAGVLHVLGQTTDEGHVYFPRGDLTTKCQEILQAPKETVDAALDRLATGGKVVFEEGDPGPGPEAETAVFKHSLFHCEQEVARRLKTLRKAPKSLRPQAGRSAVAWVQQRMRLALATRQVDALQAALKRKVLVITGGPGTGKTTIIRGVLDLFDRLRAAVLLAAPTGRAAKRLSEASGRPARTLHRLLEFSFAQGGFQRHAERPLACDLLVVDEASMIDVVLMHHLLQAVPDTATLILVGDVHQLPSVGPGNVLGDIIASGAVATVELTEIFRQARRSRIVVNAHRINRGRFPRIDRDDPETDFFFIEKADPEAVLELILRLATDRIPARYGLDPVADIQVLSPMHRGPVGAANLNRRLQEALNPGDATVAHGDGGYRAGDKVMQIRNNYDKDVFNGDIGCVEAISSFDRQVRVRFDERAVDYDYSELDELALAYAVSVHKSQGSEYPAVIVPVVTQHYILLQRNLIYTAVTRGRRLVVLVGTRKALHMAVRNDRPLKRFTRLAHRLR